MLGALDVLPAAAVETGSSGARQSVSDSEPLTDGLVITIEPMVSAGTSEVAELDDGWTVVTLDGARSAHFEHTIVVRADQPPLVLTA